jgi:hypothetical protein
MSNSVGKDERNSMVLITDESKGKFAHPPPTTPSRLIIHFEEGKVDLSESYLTELPSGLAKAGVESQIWLTYMKRFQDVQNIVYSKCMMNFLMCCVCGIPFLMCNVYEYDRAFREWISDLNSHVLGPKGLHAKFQTNSASTGKFNDDVEEVDVVRWIAISLTRDDAVRLKLEPDHWQLKNGQVVPIVRASSK